MISKEELTTYDVMSTHVEIILCIVCVLHEKLLFVFGA